MRSSLVTGIAALTLALGGGAAPALANGWTGPEVVDLLNFQRAANGLPADVAHDPALSAGCADHMAYLKLNGKFQQRQDPGDPGTSDAGAEAGMTSVLTSGSGTFAPDGTNAFEHAPIHLMQMMSPWIQRSGASGGCLVTLAEPFRTFAEPGAFSYPGPGGVAPASEVARESPFVPGDFVGLPQGTTTGPHLYFFAVGPGDEAHALSRGAFTSATLTGPRGESLPVRTVDDTTFAQIGGQLRHLGDLLAPGGIIIPVSPLEPGAVYTASATFRPNGGNGTPAAPISRTWSFTAGAEAPKPPLPSLPTPDAVVDPTVISPSVVTPPATHTPAPAISTPRATAPRLTTLRLVKRAVSIAATQDGAFWIAIERRKPKAKGGTRAAVYTRRQAITVKLMAGRTLTRAVKALPKGEYRLTVRLGSATGAVQLRKTVKLR